MPVGPRVIIVAGIASRDRHQPRNPASRSRGAASSDGEPMNGRFPSLKLPIAPPLTPMEAVPSDRLPTGAGWLYEPRWDGFRCVVFRDARVVVLQSKQGEPLTRYFPELVMAVASLPAERFVLDGEIAVIGGDGRLSYADLEERIHPSARRVAQLSGRTPATFLATELLAENDKSYLDDPLAARRKRLERFFAGVDVAGVHLSPATTRRTQATDWLKQLGDAGLDGLVARRADEAYSGGKGAAVWYRPRRTAQCVVGGLRRASDGKDIASLLLGLHDEEGLLQFVGGTATLPPDARRGLDTLVDPLAEAPGFTGRSPASESRAGHVKTRDWEPLRPVLVCEVEYDHFTGDHFRHPPTFLRWLPRANPRVASFDQVRPASTGEHGLEVLGL